MLNIGAWNQNALRPVQPSFLTDIEEAFDFLVYAANGLNLPLLVHRAGHGEILPQRKLGQGRQKRVELGRRSTVPFDASVRLLEYQTRIQRHRRVQSVATPRNPDRMRTPLE